MSKEKWQGCVRRSDAKLFARAPRGGSYAHRVDHLFSYVFDGYRYYAFASEIARQNFLQSWPRAEECTNPHPEED